MTDVAQLTSPQTSRVARQVRESYDAFKARGLKLNLTRGKPASAQLDLSAELLALPGSGRLHGRGRDRRPQLRRPSGAHRSPPPLLHAHGRAGRADRCRQQRQPRPHARHHRLRPAQRNLRQREALVAAGRDRLPVPRPRLRPPLQNLRGLRHPHDPRLARPGRPRHGPGRAPRRRRCLHQGHLVRAQVQQPHRRGLLSRGGRAARVHEDRCARFPPLLGRRLLRAPSHRRARPDRQHSRSLRQSTATPTVPTSSPRRPRSRCPAPALRSSPLLPRTSSGSPPA